MNEHHDEAGYTIGRLASVAGVNVETVRYYQRRGLITEPDKPVSGFRKYSTEIAERILFIKRAQKLGFNLSEITELLDLGSSHCHDVRQRAEAKRDKIEQQILDLQALHKTLNKLICACREGGKDNQYCPIVETLLERAG